MHMHTAHVIPIPEHKKCISLPISCSACFCIYIILYLIWPIVLFSSDLLVHAKCFRSIRCNEWAQCSPTLSVWAAIDLISLNNKVKFHSPICSTTLYHWHQIVLFSGWIINPFHGPCFSEMFSGHCGYWFSNLTASSAKWQEEHWTVKSGVRISNDAAMNTSRDR